MNDVDLRPILGQEVSLLHGTVSSAHHCDGLVAEDGGCTVTHCTGADALVPAG
jgi:hypothetical protein